MVQVTNDFRSIDGLNHFELCDCDEKYVELMDTEVIYEKRDYYWIEKEYLCLNCEMMWKKKTYVVGKGDNWEITQLPYEGEEE